MASRGTDLIPVVQKSYDLCAGLYTHVNRFPRAQRGLLGRVMIEDALQMLVSLTVANRRVCFVDSPHRFLSRYPWIWESRNKLSHREA